MTAVMTPTEAMPMEEEDLGDGLAKDEVRVLVGQNLRGARVRRRMNQGAVSSGMQERGFDKWSRPTVSEVERGRRGLLVEELVALSYVLDTRVSRLLARPAVPEEIVEMVEALGGRIIFEKSEPKDAE